MYSPPDLTESQAARREGILAYAARVKAARLAGREFEHSEAWMDGYIQGWAEEFREGNRPSAKIGVIHVCEHLLHRAQTATESLHLRPIEELTRLAEELEAQVRTNGERKPC